MKWKPGLEEKEVELLMAEVLKHAPSAHSKRRRGYNSSSETRLTFEAARHQLWAKHLSATS
jgi:hypothetical protein